MTTSIESKTLRKITSWDEIYKLKGYTNSLDPTKERLQQVIIKYELPDKGKCGLSTCGTPHYKGYIVQTETGKLTNLGHICGKNHFGSSFTTLKNKLDREIDYQNKLETIRTAKLKINSNYAELIKLENDWNNIEDIYRTIQLEELDELFDRLEIMKRNKNLNILYQREAEKFERELEEVRTGKPIKSPYYIDEKIGELKGLNYLTDRIRVEAILRNCRASIRKLDEFDINDKSFKEIKEMSAESEHIQDSIRKLKNINAEGFTLFKKSNIEQFEPLIFKKKKRKFRRLLKKCFEE